jgi:hypothetical protein
MKKGRGSKDLPRRNLRHGMIERESTRGFVLPAAVVALVLVGVLVTGGFYLARQETRVGVASLRAGTAFYLAERGAMETMSRWDMTRFGALAQWNTATVADTVDEGIWSVNVTRMSSRLYFLLATGSATAGRSVYGSATRMLGIVARLRTADLEPKAALTTVNSLRLGGSATVIGHDQPPGSWPGLCDPAGASKPGVLIDDLDNISYSGNAYTLEGDPPALEDENLTTDDLMTFGDLTWDELVALATKVYPPGASTITQLAPDSVNVNGSWECNTAPRENWGTPRDPTGVCGSYFPIIYSQGNLKIAASDAGQGIMLIEGDLEITGGHEFYGPVIIKGTLKTTGTGGHFNGGVIAANVDLESSTVLGDALVQFSRCAIQRAVLNNSDLTRVRPLAQRSWVDLSSVASG